MQQESTTRNTALPEDATLPLEEDQQTAPQPSIPIELRIPAWMMRDPGPAIDIEDDEWID
jgi:hypothetical protein